MIRSIADLRIKIFADGAGLEQIRERAANPLIAGFTTNPTLMRKAGVSDYEAFAKDVIEIVPDRPVSFEVLADDFAEMRRQALKIASWGRNVFVKIPVTNTRGESAAALVRELSSEGVALNITAILDATQVRTIVESVSAHAPSYISIFAGRIADTGRDPVPIVVEGIHLAKEKPLAEVLWCSPRELLNIVQADEIGCHIITVTNDLLAKTGLIGKDLCEFSIETVQMFYDDARSAGLSL